MRSRTHSFPRGFTLIELAIVLAIAGLLFVGLWRLLSGGNTQLRDQSAASQQTQLIAAVKAFLTSTDGPHFMTFDKTGNPRLGGGAVPPVPFQLPLPSAANAPDGGSNTLCLGDPTMTGGGAANFCNFLPPGFSQSTANSYGQTYFNAAGFGSGIRILRDSTLPSNPPHTFSFMIMTTGGDIIPDTSGGRITSIIGGDGGFVYGSAVCNALFLKFSCGTYGAWVAAINSFGLPDAPSGGYIATRTFVSPEQDSLFPWLARIVMPGDVPNAPSFNTMTTDLLVGSQTVFLGTDKLKPDGGNTIKAIDMQGGTLDVHGGVLDLDSGILKNTGAVAFSGATNIDPNGVTLSMPDFAGGVPAFGLTLYGSMLSNKVPPFIALNPVLKVLGACSKSTDIRATGPGGLHNNVQTDASGNMNCSDAVSVQGDMTVNGLLNAFNLFAGTFIYQTSDIRLKTNIHPLENSMASLMKLKPVSFAFKGSGQEGLGFIAQDVEKIYPQLVTMNGGTKYLNYDGLIGPLVDAVQQLKDENDALRQELKAQGLQQKALEQKLEQKSQ
jgi:prepilin-type N-terminal cleavage/methylation domain-containing protein